MTKTKILTVATLAGVLTLSANAVQAHAVPDGMEKCYGVAKTGMNDCGANGHSCAGMAKTDGDAHEWVALPEGTCDKIVGGTTEKPSKDDTNTETETQ